jgi:hypothetical protein
MIVPIGQKCLKSGFKRVTERELYDRLGCEASTIREMDKAVERLATRHHGLIKRIKKEPDYGYVSFPHAFSSDDTEHYIKCFLAYESFDSYMREVIPDHCLKSVDKAKEIGLSEFKIAYATHVENRELIIVGMLPDGSMVEIDSWKM